MRLNFIALFLFVGQILRGQSSDTFLISNSEIKSFIKDSRHILFSGKTLRLSDKPYVLLSQSFLEKTAVKDSIFSKADVEFIMKQIEQRKNLLWSSEFIDDVTVIKSNDIDSLFRNSKIDAWNVFYKKYGGDFKEISFPYFSQDKQTCIIYISNHCGWLCGEGGIRIYKRKNNVWVLYKSIEQWVS